MSSNLICILGPTASGKTKYAVRAASAHMGEIISADSRQVYRGMDIGTGKDLNEYIHNGVAVPFHLIDIAEPGTKYNIFEYQRDFQKAYNSIIEAGRQPFLCGGSGLYIQTATMGYELREVPPDPVLREELEMESTEELIKRLSSMKALHNVSDTQSRKRLVRALEIAIYSQNCDTPSTEYAPIKTRYIGMNVSREERNLRIDRRVKERLQNGMVEEVQNLLKSGIPPEDLIYYGLEYKFLTLYLIGKLTFKEMESGLTTAIHQFAKRQMTWFRGMERRGITIEWVDPESDFVV
ncbi:MAG: tRNA (adenosine(37)-N6)-dimethylallyltransferase MiaA [Bacteroidales bacterium]|jgi:tRNA dimethylallyltransferase|nr:tRNA (adenosine(37)-N6)-dimethylallyltransferase MiaA [Bacteroidales bacterium]MDZ4058569.1 tRNA (adenosine(37)-N6)-dimethylallyltransferase MiaA [Bacteroidales bacterium]